MEKGEKEDEEEEESSKEKKKRKKSRKETYSSYIYKGEYLVGSRCKLRVWD